MRVTVFAVVLGVIILLYGGMHYYLFIKLQSLFAEHRKLLVIVLLFCGCSVFISEFLLHQNIQSVVVYPMALFAFSWMGYVFIFFAVSIVVDAGALLAHVAKLDRLAMVLDSPQRTVGALLLAFVIAVQGFWSARQVNIERVNLASDKLSHALRVVQISDLHLGMLTSINHLHRLVMAINDLAPDIIVSTGDLVDMELDHREDMLRELSRLNAKFGKYAVYGNHEILAGLQSSREFTLAAGFMLLSGNEITVDNIINIAGVDDPMVKRVVEAGGVNEADMLKQHANGHYTLLLKHQPVIDQASTGWFDLQLSGHVHGGQIFPFGILTWLTYRTPTGLSRVGLQSWLYVSRGTGTWGPPMRVLAPPEISVFELRPAMNLTQPVK